MAKVYAVQMDIAWEDHVANRQAVDRLTSAASIEAGSLVVLPEMFDAGFTMNPAAALGDLASDDYCRHLARRLGSTVVAGFARENESGKPSNQLGVYSSTGEVVARYRKQRLFTTAGEHVAFTPGHAPTLFEWNGLKFATFICYDLRFPELFRDALDLGAHAMIVIANWPSVRVEHWLTLCRARAIENQAYVICVNRTGSDPSIGYPGRSQIIDPKGQVLADAEDRPSVIVADLHASAVTDWRKTFPAVADRVK